MSSSTSPTPTASAGGAAAAAAVAGACQPGFSEDLLFLLMGELATVHNEQLNDLVHQFEQNTRIQGQYARFRKVMSTLQKLEAAKEGGTEGIINADQLRQAGLSEREIDEFMRPAGTPITYSDDTPGHSWTPAQVAEGLNQCLFGENVSLHVTGITLGEFPRGDEANDRMQTEVFNAIEDAQSCNVQDTTLLSTAISQTVNEMNRMTNMFSKILQKLDEGQMAIIRNM